MDLPKHPEDIELKNIIDKLANFVARNGHEFEHMTKQKQKDNAKFSFLFGGEFFNYYQYKVTTEQAIMNQQKQKMSQQQQQQQQQHMVQALHTAPPPCLPWQQPGHPQHNQQLEQAVQANTDQIKQSEANLAAQYQSLMQQRQIQIDESIFAVQEEELQKLSVECELPFSEFDLILEPIAESCTKDAISTGKNWIFTHYSSEKHSKLIVQYLKKKICAKDVAFEVRLHMIYLINDVLHHCTRKNVEGLKKALGTIMIPVFCHAHSGASDDKKEKLVKLLNLWDQNKYFDNQVIQELREPIQAMVNYQGKLSADYPNITSQITTAVHARYSSLQQQHQDFVGHLNTQIQQLEQQLAHSIPPAGPPLLPEPTVNTPASLPLTSTVTLPPGSQAPPMGFPPPNFNQPPPNFNQPPPGFGGPTPAKFEYSHGQGPPVVQEYNHGQRTLTPPPTAAPLPGASSAIQLPDFSKPPPGFPPLPGPPTGGPAIPPPVMPPVQLPNVTDADLMPSVPYFELPAGLMAPLVKLEDCSYNPLVPKDIRLPPPMPPNERLLAAVEAFYSPPSHERPRDSEGWEKLGLFEFFKAKQKAKKLKEEQQKQKQSRSSSSSSSGSGSDSDSPSTTSSPQRRSASSPRRRSASRSPPRYAKRSPKRSPSPARIVSKERTQSPTTFTEPFYATNTDTRLSEDNKGHMLMRKMGWGGGGLGSAEQGIVDPVQHAEVRDRVDMFKGVGMSNADPFEQFRKSKSHGFIQRMKDRDPK